MKTDVQYGFGRHLMLDCYGCPKDKLADSDFIFSVLDNFPEKIKATKVMPPYVFKYHGPAPDDWGLSGVKLVAESHISIHTFPDKGHAFIDIFSGKEFDADGARQALLEEFSATRHEVVLLDRSLEFPGNMARAADFFNRERPDLVGSRRIYH